MTDAVALNRAMMTNAVALAAFETLVQTQQPASTAWVPVTDYSFEARAAIEGPHARLILDVFNPTRLLDYGCGYGHLLRLLEAAFGLTTSHYFCGFEPAEALACEANRHVEVFDSLPRFARARRRQLLGGGADFDLVICREVFEHLTVRQIRRAVTDVCDLSTRYVYVTTRFHQSPQHLLDVATSDDLDPTHITMLNQDFLRLLFVLEGFRRRADLEARMDWKGLGRVLVYERV